MNTLRRYIFWTYERGSMHYDIMVTLILAFIFIAPHYINFNDKPVTNVPLRSSEVLVKSADINGNFVFEVRASDLNGATTDFGLRTALLRVIEPIAGAVNLVSYTPVTDPKGNIVAYDATVTR